jgi:hypothetical protein
MHSHEETLKEKEIKRIKRDEVSKRKEGPTYLGSLRVQ